MANIFKRIRKRWLCWKYGICPVHGQLRPHGGYNQGRWAICAACLEENRGKSTHRDVVYEASRNEALTRLNRDWPVPNA